MRFRAICGPLVRYRGVLQSQLESVSAATGSSAISGESGCAWGASRTGSDRRWRQCRCLLAAAARRHRGRQPEPPRRCRYHGVDIRTQSRGKRLFLDFQVDSPYISRLFKGLDIQTFEVLPVACTVVIAGGLQGCSNSRRLYLRSPEWQQDQRSHGVT